MNPISRMHSIYSCILTIRLHSWHYCRTISQEAALPAHSTLHHTATQCNTVQHTAAHCSTLQHTAEHCSTLQHTATHCSTNNTTHCNTLQCTATHCYTLQHTATHPNTLPTLQRTATQWTCVAVCVAVCCSVLQCTEIGVFHRLLMSMQNSVIE